MSAALPSELLEAAAVFPDGWTSAISGSGGVCFSLGERLVFAAPKRPDPQRPRLGWEWWATTDGFASTQSVATHQRGDATSMAGAVADALCWLGIAAAPSVAEEAPIEPRAVDEPSECGEGEHRPDKESTCSTCRWLARQIDEEWDQAEADLYEQP